MWLGNKCIFHNSVQCTGYSNAAHEHTPPIKTASFDPGFVYRSVYYTVYRVGWAGLLEEIEKKNFTPLCIYY